MHFDVYIILALRVLWLGYWACLRCSQPVAGFGGRIRSLLPYNHAYIHASHPSIQRCCRQPRSSSLCAAGESTAAAPPNDITVVNSQSDHGVDERLIHDACELYRSKLGFPDFSVDVLILDADDMTEANMRAFGKNCPTDIISNAANSQHTRKQYHLNRSPQQVAESRHLGEILLCPSYVLAQMTERQGSPLEGSMPTRGQPGDFNDLKHRGVAVRMQAISDLNERLCYLLAHGFLHLLGYDHVADSDYEEMLAEEDALIDAFVTFYRSRSADQLTR
ncbi:Probable rRNA maturation factor [Babesia bigemina]|uniref:Probable rRNA maturation factor n=1 Tax=Babesia bigemina TaxID=5866 RepID=A0A061DD44_BABBI|nr:Probable rRNA maturation factor [Babesia bigemina]CDR95940.1 Probable rRNA maturation factor [Babesia bigemina]|eukprot:XP_012768126.1 Probable rRNA maturation factor [Babesia bigemina]